MKLTALGLAALAGAMVLSACTAPPRQEDTGMVVGGILGGVLGSQVGEGGGRTAATIVGSLVGAAIGGAVGRSMDEQDRRNTSLALENVRTGVPSQWRNPDTGNRYSVVPTRTYDTPSGPCREYTVDGLIGGRHEKVHGTACRQSDGSWLAAN